MKGKINRIVSFFVLFIFIGYKLTKNLLLLPIYFVRDYRKLHDYFYFLVSDTINVERTFQNKIKILRPEELKIKLKGCDPHIHFKFESASGNISFLESQILAYFVKVTDPKTIFEIGTFDGFSTYHLAMNSSPSSKIFTLNLPLYEQDNRSEIKKMSIAEYRTDLLTHYEIYERGLGVHYKECSQSHKVEQLLGDSIDFDFSPYTHSIDLCFIDGGHSWKCLVSDTYHAFSMLSERGMILWHDFNVQHKDVYKYLMKLSEKYELFWIKDTRIAVYFGKKIN